MNPILKRGLTLSFILLIGLLAITPLPRLALSQNPAPQRIESDDTSVTRAGNWTSQAASQASGGSYLYSSGVADDVLTLQFSGPTIEVIFVAGPSLGTLAINVDDIVLRTVITTADQTAYQQSSRIDYLSDEPHTLKVYAQAGGVVGVDAFVVPTPSPTPPLSGEGNADGETRDGLGSGDWMARYVYRFPTTATCSIPNLNLASPPSGTIVIPGSYPVSEINFDWGNSSGPAQVSPRTDEFAIEFRRTVTFTEATTVTINYMADDAIRMYDNGTRFWSMWGCYSAMPTYLMHTFTAGTHDLVIQYVEVTGSARITVAFSAPVLTATRQSDTQINLAWTDVLEGETEYRVERSPDGLNNWSEIATVTAATTQYSDTGLACGVYYYRVRGYYSDTDSYSLYSNVANANTTACSQTPSNLTATTLDDGRIQLNWTDNASDETEYRIERSPDGLNNWMEIGVAPVNTTAYTNVSLICGTTYHYRVRAYRASDMTYSGYSNVANATTAACPATCEAVQQRIQRLSVGMDGGAPDSTVWIGRRSLSDDGRYAVFSSHADNLVPVETNLSEVFLFDRMTCQTTLISTATSDTPSRPLSWSPSISGDGRYILYEFDGSDLDPYDVNLFLHDRQTGTTVMVSQSIDEPTVSGGFWGMLSGNGRYVAFVSQVGLIASDTNNSVDVYVRDLQSNTLEIASLTSSGALSSGGSAYPYISYDGQYVTFISAASLVPEDANNNYDVYLRDRVNDTVTLVSYGDDETAHGAMSEMPHINTHFWVIYAPVTPDGRYVAFVSATAGMTANNTNEPSQGGSQVYLRDVLNGTTTLVSADANGNSFVPSISDDGRYIVFSSDANIFVVGDTNYHTDVYRYDRLTETISWVSQTFDGDVPNSESAAPYITPDGRYVSFYSGASNLLSEGGYPGMVLVEPSLLFAPGSFLTNTAGSSAITLNWSDANADETEFRIEQSLNGTAWTVIATLPANTTHYLNENLVCNTTYHYRVRAYRASDATYSPYSNVATATTSACPLAAPSILTATTLSQTSIQLAWTDNASDETNFTIERSFNGTTDWSQIGSTVTNVANFTDTVYLACGTPYYYRVRAYRSGDGVFSAYSNTTNANTSPCRPDALAMVNPATRSANLIRTLDNSPAGSDSVQFATGLPFGTGGQYVTGDWNGDGLDTLGVYWNGAFFFTNDFGTGGTWGGIWFGLGGQPVVGRFDANVNHDCLGVTDSGTWTNGDTFFALYFTCNLTSGPTPPLTFQWLSILLPNSQGFTGTFQFVAGDFNGDGVDSVAVRRGAFIAWTNIPPTTLLSQFSLAQYIGAPGTGDEGKVVAGDWDMNNVDSFGLVYQNGTFYRRNDVEWNTGVYILQTFTPSVGTPFDVVSWRPN